MTPRRITVVPHTHWDREWYEPFQTFRLRLVDLLDHLIPLLETDPSYAHYLLDGQMAVVDDYLEVRPEMESRLRSLAASGRLAMGPWYILVDEFLVSGETMIRDLQLGIERGAAFGGVTSVGYLPDMFGHIAQMPKFSPRLASNTLCSGEGSLRRSRRRGSRGSRQTGRTFERSTSLRGTETVRHCPATPRPWCVASRITSRDPRLLFDDVLLMNGSDHLLPQDHLGRVVAEANGLQDDLHFEVDSLANHLERAPREDLESWHGELRSGFRSNILMGVLSNRVDVKRAASLTERALEKRAEPYNALFRTPHSYPDQLLALAWREVIRNAAHDSICACSVDDTVNAVLHRFAEARHIAAGLAQSALGHLATQFSSSGTYVVNALARPRQGVVEVVLTDDQLEESRMQIVEARSSLPSSMTLDATAMRAILSGGSRQSNRRQLLGARGDPR
jgi:hypothetical protein